MTPPLVSIIIPVYNGSNFLKEAIDSALNQTYKNIEVIVVNDGSNDNGATEAIAKSYKNKIRYFSKPNGGVSTALNLGIKKMKGEYFSWLSHDDLYYPNKIERQMNFLSSLKNKSVMLFSDFEVLISETGNREKVVLDAKMLKNKPKYSIARCCINGITVLLPKKIIDQVGEFNENLKFTQDYDYWMRVQDKVPAVHMDEIFTTTRIHPSQDSLKEGAKVEIDNLWLQIINWMTEKEKRKYEGSTYAFLKEMLFFLNSTDCQKAKKTCKDLIIEEKRKLKASLKKVNHEEIFDILEYLEKSLCVCLDKKNVVEKENAILFERIKYVDAENQRLIIDNQKLSQRRIKTFIKKIINKARKKN